MDNVKNAGSDFVCYVKQSIISDKDARQLLWNVCILTLKS